MTKLAQELGRLNDAQLEQIVRVRFNNPINPLNFKALYFNGVCDGTALTRKYSANDLKGNYVRIIEMQFAYYADNSIWQREIIEDNATLTNSTNSRYASVQPYTRLDFFWLEKMVTTNQLQILVDQQPTNIFSTTYFPAIDKINLNILPQNQLQDGIDVKLNMTFYKNMEGVSPTTANPYVSIIMLVELLNDIKPLEIVNANRIAQ